MPTEENSIEEAELALGDCFARGPAKTEIQEAIHVLNVRLANFAVLYESRDLDQKRSAVSGALIAVTDFLEAQAFPPSTLLPIMHPALALAEREHRNLDPLFCTRPCGGRPRSTVTFLERQGVLAAFANAWLEQHKADGRPQRLKLSEAARKMRGGWFGEVTRANLKTARDMVSEEAKDHPAVVMAKTFEQLFDQAIETFGAASAFQMMIDYVNQAPAGRMMGISKTPPCFSDHP